MSAARPVKVLQVIDTLSMGGAETWLMEVLRLWAKSGAGQMDFLLTSGNRGLFDEEAEHLGAKLHYLRFGRSDVGRFIAGLREMLSSNRYNAIHDHQDCIGGWHLLMGAGMLPPVRVVHVHNPILHINANYGTSPSRRLTISAGRNLVNMFATHVCGTSQQILRLYGFDAQRSSGPEILVVHCGIDINVFNSKQEVDWKSVLQEFGWDDDVKVVLFVGRLDRAIEYPHPQNHKNSWFALNVLRTAIAKDSSLRLIMAGASDHVSVELNNRICGWGLQDKLRIVGIRKDVARLMHAANVLLFPSAQEGLGMAAVEAQAAGLPVLASTAVPREAIVIPELYDVQSLDASLGTWADSLIARILKSRPTLDFCLQRFERSPFSIVNSARHLERIYWGSAE